MLTETEFLCKLFESNDILNSWEKITHSLKSASEDGSRLDEVERVLLKQLLELGQTLLKKHVESYGRGDLGEKALHPEHGTLRRAEQPSLRTYQSVFGEFQITRWTYHERAGQKALYIPVDQHFGLPAQKQSYVVEDWLERLTVLQPYLQAVHMLQEVANVKTSVRSAERMNRQLARHVKEIEAEYQKPDAKTEGAVIVTTSDGKGVPVRTGLEQRKAKELGKKPREVTSTLKFEKTQKRRTAGSNKSTKQTAYVGAVYTVERFARNAEDVLNDLARKENNDKRPRPQNKHYYVEMTQIVGQQIDEAPKRLFSKLAAEVILRNDDPEAPKEVITLMDGQRTLWTQQRAYLPDAIAILDIYHVAERLWSAAYCHHPKGSKAAEGYATRQLRRLLRGDVKKVIRSMHREQGKLKGNKKKEMAKVITYFKTNVKHMRYDEYLAKGYPIGSGVVEGACRHVVKDRMELSGMRWEIEGAQAMLSLRATYINNHWDKLLNKRIEAELSSLYSLAV